MFPGSKGYPAGAEQFTHFGTMQFEGHEVANPTGQYENTFITQLADTAMTEEYLGPRIVASCGWWSGKFRCRNAEC